MAQFRIEIEKNKHPMCIVRPWGGGAFSVCMATTSKNPKKDYEHFLVNLKEVAEKLERLGLHPCGQDSFVFDLEKYKPW